MRQQGKLACIAPLVGQGEPHETLTPRCHRFARCRRVWPAGLAAASRPLPCGGPRAATRCFPGGRSLAWLARPGCPGVVQRQQQRPGVQQLRGRRSQAVGRVRGPRWLGGRPRERPAEPFPDDERGVSASRRDFLAWLAAVLLALPGWRPLRRPRPGGLWLAGRAVSPRQRHHARLRRGRAVALHGGLPWPVDHLRLPGPPAPALAAGRGRLIRRPAGRLMRATAGGANVGGRRRGTTLTRRKVANSPRRVRQPFAETEAARDAPVCRARRGWQTGSGWGRGRRARAGPGRPRDFAPAAGLSGACRAMPRWARSPAPCG